MQIKTILGILAFTGAAIAAPVEATTEGVASPDGRFSYEYKREGDATADPEGRFSYDYRREEAAAPKPDGRFSYEYEREGEKVAEPY